MPISINQLVKEACELTSLVAPGESVDGNMATSAVAQLNRAISVLNSQDYIAGAVRTADVSGSEMFFRFPFPGEAVPGNAVAEEPPEKVSGVSRRVGDRFLRLAASDPVAVRSGSRRSLASSFCYDVYPERVSVSGKDSVRMVGRITLDGRAPQGCRVFYNSKIPQYRLSDTCYLSDIYRDMLVNALCVGLCDLYKLVSYRPLFEERLAEAKRLVKRDRIAGRMLRFSDRIGDYRNPYFAGLSGEGF